MDAGPHSGVVRSGASSAPRGGPIERPRAPTVTHQGTATVAHACIDDAAVSIHSLRTQHGTCDLVAAVSVVRLAISIANGVDPALLEKRCPIAPTCDPALGPWRHVLSLRRQANRAHAIVHNHRAVELNQGKVVVVIWPPIRWMPVHFQWTTRLHIGGRCGCVEVPKDHVPLPFEAPSTVRSGEDPLWGD